MTLESSLANRKGLHLLVILVVGFLAYSNTFHGPIQWDGVPTIRENPLMNDVANFLPGARGYAANPRRFIGTLTFALNHRFGGTDPTGYHVVNLLIHLVNALLVYFLTIMTFRTPVMRRAAASIPEPPLIALFSALLFVAHPIQTQAVTYIYQRYTSLATLFYLLSVVLYVRGRLMTEDWGGGAATRRGSAALYYLAALVSAVLAMKTKEIAFTLPLAIMAYEFIFFKLSLKKKLLFLLPIALTIVIIPLSVLHSDQSLGSLLADVEAKTRLQTDMPRWDYLATEFRVIVTYLRLLLLPVNQNVDYDYPRYHSFLAPPVFLSCALLFALLSLGVFFLYRSRRERQVPDDYSPYYGIMGFGIIWFFLTLAVESSVIPIVDVIFEHRVYLPSAGVAVGVTTGAFMLARRFRALKAVIIMLCLLTLAFAVAAYARNAVWTNTISLWSDTVRKSPELARPRYNLGDAYYDAGLPAESLSQYEAAVRMKPDDAEAHYNLGTAYLKQNRNDEAIGEFQKSLALQPDYALAHNNLGTVYSERGKLDDALREFKAAVAAKPGFSEAHYNLGSAYSDAGRFEDAAAEFKTVLRLAPDNVDALNSLGEVYKQMGLLDEAAGELLAALRLKPAAADTHFNLGTVYFLQGRIDDAIGEFRTTITMKPDDADAHNNLAMAYYKKGKIEDAIREIQTAVTLRPDDEEARHNLESLKRIAESKRGAR